ncbi:MAG: FAD-dependent oxidoreductase [bacterium]|nr:FAD-dependent oxidoreductase [bacterium]MDZ4296447.1 FAD-dependent oxidoreductase [Patescibacteria group bacterium]
MQYPKDEVYWHTLRRPNAGRTLAADRSVDVAVVGGGVAGLAAAQALTDAGLSVALVERAFCGAGASGKSSGFITPDSELELSHLISTYGPDKAKKLWEFVLSGVELIRQNILKFGIECDYQVQDSLFVANSARGARQVAAEVAARQQLGYESRFYDRSALPAVIGSPRYYGAVRYPGTFGITSYLYCQGLKEVLAARGVEVYEGTAATAVMPNRVVAGGYTIGARHVVLAADWRAPELVRLRGAVYHAQTFLGISGRLSERVLGRVFPGDRLMVWDTDLIYQYYRVTGDGRLLIGGGDLVYTYAAREKHGARAMARKLEHYLQKHFPDVTMALEYLWPGLIGVSKDLLPVAGAVDGVYVVTGAAGLPWAAALGRYIAEKLVSGRDDYDHEFSPERGFPVGEMPQRFIGTRLAFALSHGISKYL